MMTRTEALYTEALEKIIHLHEKIEAITIDRNYWKEQAELARGQYEAEMQQKQPLQQYRYWDDLTEIEKADILDWTKANAHEYSKDTKIRFFKACRTEFPFLSLKTAKEVCEMILNTETKPEPEKGSFW